MEGRMNSFCFACKVLRGAGPWSASSARLVNAFAHVLYGGIALFLSGRYPPNLKLTRQVMARIMTKTGDKGTTGIFGGERVPKDDPRIEANGAMDELNAHLGLIRAHIPTEDPRHRFFGEVQMRIMQAMSLIATRSERREENPNHFDLQWVEELEAETARLMAEIPENGFFILPGGTILSAEMQLARTVARRAERRLWTLERLDPLPEGLIPWVNRMSDWLFVSAKWEMHQQGWPEDRWQAFSYKRKKKQPTPAE